MLGAMVTLNFRFKCGPDHRCKSSNTCPAASRARHEPSPSCRVNGSRDEPQQNQINISLFAYNIVSSNRPSVHEQRKFKDRNTPWLFSFTVASLLEVLCDLLMKGDYSVIH